MATTARSIVQTAARVDGGVAALSAEIRRQTGQIRDREATISDLDVRKLYLAIDVRAARILDAVAHLNGSATERDATVSGQDETKP